MYMRLLQLPLSQTRPCRIKRPQEQIPSSSMPAKGNACNHFWEINSKRFIQKIEKELFSVSDNYKKIPRFLGRKFGIPNIPGLWSKEPQIKKSKEINRELFFLFWIVTRLFPDSQIYHQIVVKRTSKKWKTFKEMLTFRLQSKFS